MLFCVSTQRRRTGLAAGAGGRDAGGRRRHTTARLLLPKHLDPARRVRVAVVELTEACLVSAPAPKPVSKLHY